MTTAATTDCSRIAPTAQLVAHGRALLGQPYAKEIAALTGAQEVAEKIIGDDEALLKRLLVHLEARFHSVMYGFARSGAKQMMGLGEGLAPNGLILTQDQDLYCLETDLPDMVQLKESAVTRILRGNARLNLGFQIADVLNPGGVLHVAEDCLGEGDVFINLEGVFPYLLMDERRTALAGIRDVLMRQDGGCALITSVLTREAYEAAPDKDSYLRALEKIMGMTGCDLLARAFTDGNEATTFIADSGFRVEQVDHVQFLRSMQIPECYGISEERIVMLLRAMRSYLLWLA